MKAELEGKERKYLADLLLYNTHTVHEVTDLTYHEC